MSNVVYDRTKAFRLLPLVRSIAREVEERELRLRRLETVLEAATRRLPTRRRQILTAELALQRKEMRRIRTELSTLGCALLGTDPVTLRIPSTEDGRPRSLIWQFGERRRPA